MIYINNISKKYKTKDSSFMALDEFSLKLPDKGLVFITGESGAGKSTLLNIIGTLDNFDSGEIHLDGINLNQMSKEQIRYFRQAYVGFVFQQFNLINELTVYENIQLAQELINSSENELAELLKLLKLDNLKDKKINELSGGEQQRVAIARALIKKPKLLLCDEPTGMLDEENSKLVFEIFKKIGNEILVLVVTHNTNLAKKFSNKIVELQKGKLLNSFEIKREEITDRKIEFNKNKNLSWKTIFKVSLSWMKIRLKSLIAISLLLLVLLTTSFISLSFLFRNNNEIIIDSLYENNAKFMSYYKEYFYDKDGSIVRNDKIGMNDDDIRYLKDKLVNYDGDVVYNYYVSRYGGMLDNDIFNHNNGTYKSYNTNKNNGLVVINQDFIDKYNMTLYGNLPKNGNEIVITKYIFDQYKLSGYYHLSPKEILKYDDLIGETIYLTDEYLYVSKHFTVVGILDTNLNEERYKQLTYDNEKNKFLQVEWDSLLDYGLHNVAYVNKECINDFKNNNYIMDANVTLGSSSNNLPSYEGCMLLEKTAEKIYYVSDPNKKNGIVLPYNFSFSSNDELKERLELLIKTFAVNNYEEIRDQFLKDANSNNDIYDSWESYYYYIIYSDINKYSLLHNRFYFEDIIINDYCKELMNLGLNKETFINLPFTRNETIIDIEIVGFYNIRNKIELERHILLISNELFIKIFKEKFFYTRFLENDYKFVVNPIDQHSKNEFTNLRNFDKKIYDDNLIPNVESNEFICYQMGNESFKVFNKINSYLEIIYNLFSIFSICVLFLLMIIIYYHYSGIIQDKIKSIGIFNALGISTFDLFRIFIMQFFIIIVCVVMVSLPIIFVVSIFLNNYINNELQIIMSIFNINWIVVISILLTCLVFGMTIIYTAISKYIKKSPIKTILTLT